MANNNESTTKFKADISELKSAFQEAQRAVKVANSELKAATAGMDDWSHTADGLSAKLKQLNSVLDGEKKKLSSLEEQYKLTAREQGENSKGAQELLIKLNNQKAVVTKVEKELTSYEDKLSDIDDESRGTEKSLDKVSDEIKETGDEAEKSGGKLKGFLGAIGKGVIGGIGAAVTGLAGGLIAASESSKEFNDNMSKLSAAAKDAGYSTGFAEKSFQNMYGILGDETAANTTVSNFMAMETSQENLNSLLNSSTGIWAKYGDSIPLDGLAESVNETAKVGQITGNLADALNWAGISEDDFNEKLSSLSTEQERQQLIVDTLNSEYGELGKQYKENNSAVIDLNTAQLQMKDSIAAIGKAFTPVLAMFTQFGAGVLSSIVPDVENLGAAFADLASGVDGAEEKIGGAVSNILNTLISTVVNMLPQIATIGVTIIQGLMSGITENSSQILLAISEIIVTLADGIVTLAPQILTSVIQIVMQIAQQLIQLAPQLLNAAIQLFQGLVDALMKLDLGQMITQLITSLCQMLIDSIPQLLNAAIDLFMSILDAIPELITSLLGALPTIINTISNLLTTSIPQIMNAAITLLMGIVDALPTIIQALVNALPGIITALINFLMNNIPVLLEAAIQLFMALVQAIPTIVVELLNAIPEIIKAIMKGLSGLPNELKTFFVNIWNSIKNVFEPAANWFEDKFKAAFDGIKSIWNSVTGFFSDIWSSITNTFSNVGGWFTDKFSSAVDGVKSAFSSVTNFFKDIWDGIKDIFSNVADWFSDVFDGAVKAIEGPINWVIDSLNYMIDALNSISFDVPDFVPGMGGKHFGLDIPNIPQLAKGGIVTKHTLAEIGENNKKEAIIPLESNLGWIKSLAGKLSDELKSVSNVNSSHNNSSVVNNFYQTNKSPKSLSRLEIYRQSKNLLSMKGV